MFGLDTNGLSSSITLNFADANNDVFFTVGEITEVSAVIESAVPEPHGESLACLAMIAGFPVVPAACRNTATPGSETLSSVRSLRHQHGLENLVGDIFDRTGRVSQK